MTVTFIVVVSFKCQQGDPVWAISSETVNSLVGLSLNFFFILPLANSGTFNFFLAIFEIFNALCPFTIACNIKCC